MQYYNYWYDSDGIDSKNLKQRIINLYKNYEDENDFYKNRWNFGHEWICNKAFMYVLHTFPKYDHKDLEGVRDNLLCIHHTLDEYMNNIEKSFNELERISMDCNNHAEFNQVESDIIIMFKKVLYLRCYVWDLEVAERNLKTEKAVAEAIAAVKNDRNAALIKYNVST